MAPILICANAGPATVVASGLPDAGFSFCPYDTEACLLRRHTANAATPLARTPSPHSTNVQPDLSNTYSHPTNARMLGSGYGHMRKGRRTSGPHFAQHFHGRDLSDELAGNPRRQQCRNYPIEAQDPAGDGKAAA
jgi:hypothetical protein